MQICYLRLKGLSGWNQKIRKPGNVATQCSDPLDYIILPKVCFNNIWIEFNWGIFSVYVVLVLSNLALIKCFFFKWVKQLLEKQLFYTTIVLTFNLNILIFITFPLYTNYEMTKISYKLIFDRGILGQLGIIL